MFSSTQFGFGSNSLKAFDYSIRVCARIEFNLLPLCRAQGINSTKTLISAQLVKGSNNVTQFAYISSQDYSSNKQRVFETVQARCDFKICASCFGVKAIRRASLSRTYFARIKQSKQLRGNNEKQRKEKKQSQGGLYFVWGIVLLLSQLGKITKQGENSKISNMPIVQKRDIE